MDKAEILVYTSSLTRKLFVQLYRSLAPAPRKKTRRIYSAQKTYHRLETDSSEDEKTATKPIQLENEGYIRLKEEILNKEKEIIELKKMLIETQNELKSKIEEENKSPAVVSSSMDTHELEKVDEVKEKNAFEGLDDMVFVSKKSKVVFEKMKRRKSSEESETAVMNNEGEDENELIRTGEFRENEEEPVFENRTFSSEKIIDKDEGTSSKGQLEEEPVGTVMRVFSSKTETKLESLGNQNEGKSASILTNEHSANLIEKRDIGVSTEDFLPRSPEFSTPPLFEAGSSAHPTKVSEVFQIPLLGAASTEIKENEETKVPSAILEKQPNPQSSDRSQSSKPLSPLPQGAFSNINKQFSFEKYRKTSKKSSRNSFVITPSLKDLGVERDDQSLALSSLASVKDLEDMLENYDLNIKPSDSQERLANLFPGSTENEGKSNFSASGKYSEDFAGMHPITIENFSKPHKDSFTFEPVFPMIESSLQNSQLSHDKRTSDPQSKQEHRKSRNSSLPWIEETEFSVHKPLNLKSKTIKPKPRHKEKANIKPEKETKKSSSMNKKLPILPLKSSRINRQRANSHGKTKPRTADQPSKWGSMKLKDDILDDIIFDEEQDPDTWNRLMLKFRQNPTIISRLLKSRQRPCTQENMRSSLKKKRATKPDSSALTTAPPWPNPRHDSKSVSSASENRPISAPEFVVRSYLHKRVKDPDWSESILDNYVTQNKKKFNVFGDASLLGSSEIEEAMKNIAAGVLTIEEQRKVFNKALSTLNTLKKELQLPEFWIALPAFGNESLMASLSKCLKLLKARALTVKAIELIHKRENVLLEIMSHARQDLSKFKAFEKINEELLQVLVFWKYMELPFSSFVYLKEDYYAKIHQDNNNLMTLFPDFQADSIFRFEKSQDSFNFDI
jgi:hypothetical protein